MLRWLLRLFFHLLYQPLAWTYDLVAWVVSLGRWKSWVLSVLPHLPGPRVLELGHGPGHLQVALHNQGLHAYGLDRSPQMSRIAHKRLATQDLPAKLVNGTAGCLPYSAGSFHQVVATFPSEYILQMDTVSEIHRVLHPQGRLIVLPVAWITGSRLLERAAAWLFRVTGQAAAWSAAFTSPLRQAGFDVREETVEEDGSKVMLLLCRKAAA